MSVGWLVHPFVILSNLYQHLWLLFAFSVFLNTKLSNYGEVFDNLMVVDINKVEGNMKEEGVKSIAHGPVRRLPSRWRTPTSALLP